MTERLKADGLYFVGLDVIDGMLIEVNVTSPTLIREIPELGGPDLAEEVFSSLLTSFETLLRFCLWQVFGYESRCFVISLRYLRVPRRLEPRWYLLIPEATPPSSVFLVTIDTLRADRLGVYEIPSSKRHTWTLLGKMAQSFLKAFAQSSTTTPSHASLFSGLYPRDHKAYSNFESIDKSLPNIPMTLPCRVMRRWLW